MTRLPSQDRAAAVIGITTAVTAASLFGLGCYLQVSVADDYSSLTRAVGMGTTYVGLLLGAVGGAVGLRRARTRFVRAALGVQIGFAAIVGIILAAWTIARY